MGHMILKWESVIKKKMKSKALGISSKAKHRDMILNWETEKLVYLHSDSLIVITHQAYKFPVTKIPHLTWPLLRNLEVKTVSDILRIKISVKWVKFTIWTSPILHWFLILF